MGLCKHLGSVCALERKFLRLSNSQRTEIYFFPVWRAGSSESEGRWNQLSYEGCSLLSKWYLVAASSGVENSEFSYNWRQKDKRVECNGEPLWSGLSSYSWRRSPHALVISRRPHLFISAITLTVTLFWRGHHQAIAPRDLCCGSCPKSRGSFLPIQVSIKC